MAPIDIRCDGEMLSINPMDRNKAADGLLAKPRGVFRANSDTAGLPASKTFTY
jgi:hypothetical protein